MSKERTIIFRAFAIGLAMNLLTVLAACMLLMEPPVSYIAMVVVLFTSWFILSNATRIVKKFDLKGDKDVTRLDDLTLPRSSTTSSSSGIDTFPSERNDIVMSAKERGLQVKVRGTGKQTV
jgi:hypothetical protein